MIIIRQVTQPDQDLMASLCGAFIEIVDGGASMGFLAPLSAAAAVRYWEGVFASLNQGILLWVAEEDGKIAGSVQLVLCQKENGSHRAEIQKLFVMDGFRGQGISSRLMSEVESCARSMGRTLLVLDTQAGSGAEAVYQHLGWIRVGEIPAYAASPSGELHATAYYYKLLTPDGSPLVEASRLVFRGFQGESDYPLLLEINRSSHRADNDEVNISLDDIAYTLSHMERLDPERDILIASLKGLPEAVGYSRLGWYSSSADTRLYYQVSFLRQECRGNGVWEAIIRQNENRLREIAAGHPGIPHQFFQAWTSDKEADWVSALENTGYRLVRRFHNMIYRLGEAPDIAMLDGFEIRPVKPEHMRKVWEAQKEMNAGMFENVDEDWLEEKYPAWLENPSHTPQFWQVAWVGDKVAGMVLARIDENENKNREQKHGYTEHVYVRPAWRKRGLASALIAQSLRVLKEQGVVEAELGVDAENESSAFNLYSKLGYTTCSIDSWYRKPIDHV